MSGGLDSAEDIFHRAMSLDPSVRDAFLSAACEGDQSLLKEVRALLAASESVADFLAKPAFESGSEFTPERTPKPESVRQIGKYRIHGVISSGGMGVVYRGEQEKPRRPVAVKVIRPGFAPVEVLRRFELEAELLGRLHHPGIAQIFEAGTAQTESGPQPFLAMEFILGSPLTDYARRKCLPPRERMKLLIQVCQAVHHAHQMGVIHRDLKPANILVDAQGRAKVLDFGLARLAVVGRKASSMHTASGQLLGTMPYMSPEQVSGEGDEIDARSDVYALGVIGFELLSGKLPYDLDRATIPQAARIIAEKTPRSLESMDRSFRGDLDTIFAKALEKEPERRYATAQELAGDLERYLRDEPIAARPPSAAYQLQKFAKRNKGVVAGVLGIIVALSVGLVATIAQANRAARSEKAAKEAQGQAELLAMREQKLRKQAERDRNRALVTEAFAKTRLIQIREHLVRQTPGRGRSAVTPEEETELRLLSESMKDIVDAVAEGEGRSQEENRRALDVISQKIDSIRWHSPQSPTELRSVLGLARSALGLD